MIKVISTDKAPAAIGPYSQAIIYDKLLFTSGQSLLRKVELLIGHHPIIW